MNKTIEQKIKSLEILKRNLDFKLMDFENDNPILHDETYDQVYDHYIKISKSIDSLKVQLNNMPCVK